MKTLLLLSLVGLLLGFGGVVATPQAQAMDPITIAVLAPYALPVAEAGAQYAMRGMANASPGFLQAGTEMFRIFLLPLGVLECTVGMPFGFFGEGVRDIAHGAAAPFSMTWHILTLPVRAMGAM
jgi:hypothetical protein